MLRISPLKSMFDRVISIYAEGLYPLQYVTIGAKVRNGRNIFGSYGHYKASSDGNVDLARDASAGGTYQGVDPMGLFWSVTALAGQPPGLRLVPKPVYEPSIFEICLAYGHIDPWSSKTVDFLDHRSCERHLVAPGVTRTEITAGPVRGTMFCPKHSHGELLPGIIDMYGTAGGVMEHRAAILSSHGFAVLSLPFFHFEGLPEYVSDVDFTYFVDAVNWLTTQPDIIPTNVGVIGLSLGACIAMNMSWASDKVSAVVAINGYHVFDALFAMSYNGKPLPVAESDGSISGFENGKLIYRKFRESLTYTDDDIYPIEKSANARFLMLCSTDDGVTDFIKSAKILCKRLQNHGKEKRTQIVVYQDAGHLLEPPFMPFCPETFHRLSGGITVNGGSPHEHAAAQLDAWPRILAFLSDNVGKPVNVDTDLTSTVSKL